mmetsp:Transcript_13527/g.36141  ORF Transcript_13527/g.36141 Transcript_13527/m.36141 type:complete len:220 (+) Transcript_13527:398-1057(+)
MVSAAPDKWQLARRPDDQGLALPDLLRVFRAVQAKAHEVHRAPARSSLLRAFLDDIVRGDEARAVANAPTEPELLPWHLTLDLNHLASLEAELVFVLGRVLPEGAHARSKDQEWCGTTPAVTRSSPRRRGRAGLVDRVDEQEDEEVDDCPHSTEEHGQLLRAGPGEVVDVRREGVEWRRAVHGRLKGGHGDAHADARPHNEPHPDDQLNKPPCYEWRAP